MKPIIVSILLMAFIAVGINSASAAVNVFVNATMPYDVLYQGEMVPANVTVKNNENFPIRIYSVGVHYDWMPENIFSSVDFGGGYLQVESNGITSPGQLLIHCDDNVTTGYHSFFYKVELNWYNSYTATWLNETVVQPGTIYVESPLKPQALQGLQFANQSLSDARSSNFTSPSAIRGLQNATDVLNDGWSAYNSNDYGRAINDSSQAIAFVSDAKIREKNYRDNATGIEKIVVSVNDKLKSVSGTSDPDTQNAVTQSTMYLNHTGQYMNSEDFINATASANQADHYADEAIKLQYYFMLKANETEAAKGRATTAMDTAQGNLDTAANMTSPSAASILSDARNKMGDATVQFSGGDYANATITANVVSTLVIKANADEASYRMMLARNKISAAGDLKSPDAKALLDNASLAYNQSQTDYISTRYLDAITHANSALKLANDSATAEQKWKDENPLSAVTPGFGLLAALLAIGIILIFKERKI